MLSKKVLFWGFIFLFVQNLTSAEHASGVIIVELSYQEQAKRLRDDFIATGSTVNQIFLQSLIVSQDSSGRITAIINHPGTSRGQYGCLPVAYAKTIVELGPDGIWNSYSLDRVHPKSVSVESCPAVVDYLKNEVYKKKYHRYGNPVLWSWIAAVNAYAGK